MSGDLEELPGVGPATAEKLRETGFTDYQGIAVASPYELSKAAEINETHAKDVIKAARERADVGGFEAGASILERREQVERLTTGHEAFDDIIGGGIETESLTEIYGNESSGRTALAHLFAVRTQLPNAYGGLDGGAAYVDSRGIFDPDRISAIVKGLPPSETEALAEVHGCAPEEGETLVESVLEQIFVSTPSSSNEQMLVAESLQNLVEEKSESEFPLRAVIIDSLTIHFRGEYTGRGELAERQQRLNKHLHDLTRIGDLHNTAIVMTNATQSEGRSYGGNLLEHTVTFRLQLLKTSGEVRHAKLVDAPNLPSDEVEFYVRDGVFTAE